METSDAAITSTSTTNSGQRITIAALPASLSLATCPFLSLTSPPPLLAATAVVSPCAACKILRRRCGDKCVLAPYFPPTDPLKFTTAHRVFGASNIIKFLQELPESERADAVSSMVYEANTRIRDPVYGCAGAICQLQNQVKELQAELARAQAELVNLHSQNANLLDFLRVHMPLTAPPQQQWFDEDSFSLAGSEQVCQGSSCFMDEYNSLGTIWEPEPLWA